MIVIPASVKPERVAGASAPVFSPLSGGKGVRGIGI